MPIKHKKINRKVAISSSGEPIDLPPTWSFRIEGSEIQYDFSKLRDDGRDEIALEFRNALWNLRHEHAAASLDSYWYATQRFWSFLTAHHEPITHLKQVDRKLINQYLAWLELQTIPNTHSGAGNRLTKATKRNALSGLKTILINRVRRNPAATSPDLDFPNNPFQNSNREAPARAPYSPTELKKILGALNKDFQKFHTKAEPPLPDLQVLVCHLIALGASTGINLQPLLDLERDSLKEHPLPDRDLLVTSKRRGWTTFSTSIRNSESVPEASDTMHAIPRTVGEHFRSLCEFTTPLSNETDSTKQNSVFLWKIPRLKKKGEIVRLTSRHVKTGLREFTKRHQLQDDRGQRLTISFSRFRPTFATELYQRTGDIRLVSQALGHASIDTTARSYLGMPPEAERNHSLVVEGMVASFQRTEVNGKILLAADGAIPLKGMKALLKNGYNTGIAKCKNPFRENESVCKKFFTCFKCPNMMVFEDDLWRLFSFYYRLLSERSKISHIHWLRTYGPIIRRIDNDIASQFPTALVETARHKAQKNPHPTWRDALL